MKQLITLYILVFGFATIQAQDFKVIVDDIKNGEIAKIETQLEDLVDYCFDDDQDLLEKPEFVVKLKEALEVIKPVSAEIVHVADSKDSDSKYAVATLKGESGNSYRMFVYTEDSKIIEIRFNKE